MDDGILNNSGLKSLLDCTNQPIDVGPIKKYLELGGDVSKLGKAEQYDLGISEVRKLCQLYDIKRFCFHSALLYTLRFPTPLNDYGSCTSRRSFQNQL